MPKKKAKRKRAKPFDRRQLPHIRAHLEAAQKHGIAGNLHTGFMIFWDSQGDWRKFDEWFLQPKVQASIQADPRLAEHYETIKQNGHKNRALYERAYADAIKLYKEYSTPPTDTLH